MHDGWTDRKFIRTSVQAAAAGARLPEGVRLLPLNRAEAQATGPRSAGPGSLYFVLRETVQKLTVVFPAGGGEHNRRFLDSLPGIPESPAGSVNQTGEIYRTDSFSWPA